MAIPLMKNVIKVFIKIAFTKFYVVFIIHKIHLKALLNVLVKKFKEVVQLKIKEHKRQENIDFVRANVVGEL